MTALLPHISFLDLLNKRGNTGCMTFELNFLVIDEKIDVKTIEERDGFYHFRVVPWGLNFSE